MLDDIISKNIDVDNIYLPVSDAKFIAGLMSLFECEFLAYEDYVNDGWELGELEYSGMDRNKIKGIMDYVRELSTNSNVYTQSDGINRFAEGKIGAAIVPAERYEEMKDQLGDKLRVSTLPMLNYYANAFASQKKNMQSISYCKGIEIVNGDDLVSRAMEKFCWSIEDTEFVDFLEKELGLYSMYRDMEFDEGYGIVYTIQQQCNENFNAVDYYNLEVRDEIQKLATTNMVATSREDVYNYIDSLYWVD